MNLFEFLNKPQMKTEQMLFNGQRSVETCPGGIFDEISWNTYSKENCTALLQNLTKLG